MYMNLRTSFYKMVEDETMFWGYDNTQLIDAVIRYNKISLLHIYIYTQLLNYHGRIYRKGGECLVYTVGRLMPPSWR